MGKTGVLTPARGGLLYVGGGETPGTAEARTRVPWVRALRVSACWRLCDNAGWLVHCPLVKNGLNERRPSQGRRKSRRDAPLHVPGAAPTHQRRFPRPSAGQPLLQALERVQKVTSGAPRPRGASIPVREPSNQEPPARQIQSKSDSDEKYTRVREECAGVTGRCSGKGDQGGPLSGDGAYVAV